MRQQSLLAGTLAIGLFPFLYSSQVQAQSFNCRYAKTADEVLICQDSALSALDEQMSSIFFRLRNTLPAGQLRFLDAEQQYWLRNRLSCGRDADCVENAYERRIRQLKAY
jgi:uncharacterized protein